jgi:4-hydroxy-tetrahydrodipicolinate reductase
VIAEKVIQTDDMTIPQGHATGVRQIGRAWVGGQERIKLSFQASVGESERYDEIEIFGVPHIRSRIMGGVHGDVATCSIILNACHSILRTMPGLHTMADIPMITSMGR